MLGAIVLFTLSSGGFSLTSDASDVESLLARFRSIDWSQREVGQNKDLADDVWKVRIEVEHELIALGPPAAPKLIEACVDSNQHVRLLAAYVLGCLNDGSAIPALMRIVSSDSYAPARLAAVEALGRLGAKESLSLVQAATEDKSSYVRNAAKWALPRVMKGEEVGDALQKLAKSNFDKSQIATAVVGKAAPDFSLIADSGETVRLSDFRGKKQVILVFMLADW
jgi:HEAT repeat protein